MENNSVEDETFETYRAMSELHPDLIHVFTWEDEFNFSKIMNYGCSCARGDYLVFLNNDTEIITPNWIELMLGHCCRNDVGAVGARLYYPDDTTQHAGVIVDGRGAYHLGLDLPRGNNGYLDLFGFTQNLSAVTAACMMTRRNAFERVNGFNELLQVAFNDVDFCLKLREEGYLVVYCPEVELYHYESLSRGGEDTPEKLIRFHRESSYLHYRWPEYYIKGDPYINQNLSKNSAYYALQ